MSTRPSTTNGPSLPPGIALFGAVIAISFAGPLVRFAGAHALAIAAWRLLFSVAFIALILAALRIVGGARGRGRGRSRDAEGLGRERSQGVETQSPGQSRGVEGLRGLSRRDWALGLGAGVLLAGHFWAWVASIQFTTIANSAVLVSAQPLFVAGLSVVFLGEEPTRRQWVGIMVAIGGAAVLGMGSFGLGGRALLGDAMALGAGMMAAGYFSIGRSLRKKLDLWSYTLTVYGAAALVLTAAVLASPGTPLTGYPPRDWLVFLALAAGPMMLGHTGINYALRYLPAYVANLASLGEPVGATLIAWLLPAIAETPPPRTLLGGILILAGIALGTLGFTGQTEADAA